MSELKPCPFCNAVLMKRFASYNGGWYMIHPDTVECLLDWFEVKQEQFEAWNTRAPDVQKESKDGE